MNTRGSGILLHITSLPSPFGIGALGPQAYKFADFLFQSKQSYWQVLPLNPTDQACGNSPYSSISAYAGNILLISPELLLESGFLNAEDIAAIPEFSAHRCDYSSVIPYKVQLLYRAYSCFKATGIERDAFEEFCVQQRDWLEDYALFVVIKNLNKGKIWNEWAEAFRDRDDKSLEQIKNDCRDEVEREKFLQYLFLNSGVRLKHTAMNGALR